MALSALRDQSYPKDRYETLAVNNDTNHELEGLDLEFPEVRFLQESRPGSYRARNKGIESSSFELIAFTDADCIPDPMWLESGVRALLTPPHPGLVGGRIDVVSRRKTRPSIVECYDMALSFPQEEFVCRYHFAATANMFTSRRIFEAVGYFDPELLSGGDGEWGFRVHRAGYFQRYCADARVVHPARRTVAELVEKSKRVAVGTMMVTHRLNPLGQSRRETLLDKALRRPRRLWRAMDEIDGGGVLSKKIGVVVLYYYLKGVQILHLTGHRIRRLSRVST